jgi:hypothetical protein
MVAFMEKLSQMHADDSLAFEVRVRHVAGAIEDQRRGEGNADPRVRQLLTSSNGERILPLSLKSAQTGPSWSAYKRSAGPAARTIPAPEAALLRHKST